MDMNDLVNTAYVGGLIASRFYNPSKGEFWPYAKYIIRKTIHAEMRKNSKILPRHRWHGRYPIQVRTDTDG